MLCVEKFILSHISTSNPPFSTFSIHLDPSFLAKTYPFLPLSPPHPLSTYLSSSLFPKSKTKPTRQEEEKRDLEPATEQMSVINFHEKESVIEWGNKRKRVIRELVKGREYATQLNHFLLHRQNPSAAAVGSPSAKELVTNVLRSFADTLSLLTSSEAGTGSNDIPRSEEDSRESRKRLLPAPTKDRRGSYKRRSIFDPSLPFSDLIFLLQ